MASSCWFLPHLLVRQSDLFLIFIKLSFYLFLVWLFSLPKFKKIIMANCLMPCFPSWQPQREVCMLPRQSFSCGAFPKPLLNLEQCKSPGPLCEGGEHLLDALSSCLFPSKSASVSGTSPLRLNVCNFILASQNQWSFFRLSCLRSVFWVLSHPTFSFRRGRAFRPTMYMCENISFFTLLTVHLTQHLWTVVNFLWEYQCYIAVFVVFTLFSFRASYCYWEILNTIPIFIDFREKCCSEKMHRASISCFIYRPDVLHLVSSKSNLEMGDEMVIENLWNTLSKSCKKCTLHA